MAANNVEFCQVAELEAEQAKLQTHCADLEAGCKLLHTEVAEVRAQWHKAVADNTRLKTELRYQRNNVQLGLGMQVRIAATAGVLCKPLFPPSHNSVPNACAQSPEVCLRDRPAVANSLALPLAT